MTEPVIIADGGAGGLSFAERREQGLVKAIKIGYGILKNDGSALDAVTMSVMSMEDSRIFNAGTGSTLGLSGEVEMDASVMTSDLKFGAVAAIRNVRYPVKIARLVMEKTDHLLLCGEGALRFARLMGIKYCNAMTRERKAAWTRQRAKLDFTVKRKLPSAKGVSSYFTRLNEIAELYGTVGVVALDKSGRIAVGTSTGGISLHLPGRVGDTPMIGGGTYADEHGGASATGHGESIMRHLIAFRAVYAMRRNPAHTAGRRVIAYANKAGCRCGVVGLDAKGGILCVHNTGGMSWAYIKGGSLKTFRK
jgi:beta-aspartyl-peptidase (threonine type)